jgi:hypothetical protein
MDAVLRADTLVDLDDRGVVITFYKVNHPTV